MGFAPGARNLLTDVAGLRVGNADSARLRSGTTVVVADRGAAAGCDVRGGAPGTRETDCLRPGNLVGRLHAVVLSGGSVFGLGAADAVAAGLSAAGTGLRLDRGTPAIPIVSAAVIYDLANGGEKDWGAEPPYARLGAAALEATSKEFPLGAIGAGRGATAGNCDGGLGSASLVFDGITVAALVVANPVGSPFMADGRTFWAWPLEIGGEFGGCRPRGGYSGNGAGPDASGDEAGEPKRTVPEHGHRGRGDRCGTLERRVRAARTCRAGRNRAGRQAFPHADGRRHDLRAVDPPGEFAGAPRAPAGDPRLRGGGLRRQGTGARNFRSEPGTEARSRGRRVKITGIQAYQATLPYVGGRYEWGRGNVVTDALTTVIVIETDSGITGCGESCPLGGTYLEAHPEGIPAALTRLAPALIGEDPRQLSRIERLMDGVLMGHRYAKSAIDVACWDILGKSAQLPVHFLLGGKLTEGGPMYRVDPPEGPRGSHGRTRRVSRRGIPPVPGQGGQ